MRFVMSLSLLFVVFACKPLQRSGDGLGSSLRSVTDGRVTLGVVPVTGDSGLDGYALLLCKNSHSYSRSSFTDDRYCRPALLTSQGQQAVFIPDQMKGHDGAINYRSMVTKAAIFMGVAGIAVIGGKYALKALGKNIERPFTFTRNLDRLAKKSSINKEVLDYSNAVKKLKKAESQSVVPDKLQSYTEAVTEKQNILKSASKINIGAASRRALDSFLTTVTKMNKNTSPDNIKNAFVRSIDAEKLKITARQEQFTKIIHADAMAVVTEHYDDSLKVLGNVDNVLVNLDAIEDLNPEKAKEAATKAKSLLDGEINKALDKHAKLLNQRKFNFASVEVDTGKIIDVAGYGAAGAGATLFLTSTLAPNLFVKHPHGAAGDSTLRSHWQKVFIFQDYGFSQRHAVKSVDHLLRKIATELNLQVNPRIAGW